MITAFLPCRKGSQRIPDKNIKLFGGVDGGLLKIKLTQLIATPEVDEIIVSSNDDRVLQLAHTLSESRVRLDERPAHLGTSETTTDALIKYASSLVSEGDILWTHVTSPFVGAEDYSVMIQEYREKLGSGFDSLVSVVKIQGFLWDKSGPVNYDRNELKWPMTQRIEPLYEVDSSAFIASADIYKRLSDRVGERPFLFVQDKRKAIDIDWPDDFMLADFMWQLKSTAK